MTVPLMPPYLAWRCRKDMYSILPSHTLQLSRYSNLYWLDDIFTWRLLLTIPRWGHTLGHWPWPEAIRWWWWFGLQIFDDIWLVLLVVSSSYLTMFFFQVTRWDKILSWQNMLYILFIMYYLTIPCLKFIMPFWQTWVDKDFLFVDEHNITNYITKLLIYHNKWKLKTRRLFAKILITILSISKFGTYNEYHKFPKEYMIISILINSNMHI